MKLTTNQKVLAGGAILLAAWYLWSKKEKKSNASGVNNTMRVSTPSTPRVLSKYKPNSWYKDSKGKWHWVDSKGKLVS